MKSQTRARLRPADLAREHGLSTQAVRNYEAWGVLPRSERTATGYRVYTPVHAAALRAFLALRVADGHDAAVRIMQAVTAGDMDDALATIEEGHRQSARDRATLAAVTVALGRTGGGTARTEVPEGERWSIGEVAHRIGLTPATIRTWERAGILRPARDPTTGYRVYTAADLQDADLAHLLRRGGYTLAGIATVLDEIRRAGGPEAAADALAGWRDRLRRQGVARLAAAARLEQLLALTDGTGSGVRAMTTLGS